MKKVLIITYHWPPSGGISVLRCLKFAKYLRDFGWEPVIYTAKDPAYQYYDYNNEKDVPDGIEIHKIKISEPINAFKKLSGRKKEAPMQEITSVSAKKRSKIDEFAMWVRGNFFIPDARCRWIKPSVKYLKKYLENNHIDAILTDGPTHTNTVIGMRVSQHFGIPWLADFQDPWTQVDYYAKMHIGKRADRKHKALEQEVFRTASKLTIASPTWKTDLESIGAKDVSVIYYGYDEDDFQNYRIQKDEHFTFFHGGLLGSDRNPENFIRALQRLRKELPQQGANIRIRLAGEVDLSVANLIEECGLNDVTTYLGMIPRAEVYNEFSKASMLLLPINKAANAKGRIPGKLFEMLRSGKPILVFGPNDGDVKSIVEEKKRGKSFDYDQAYDIYTYLHSSIISGSVSEFDHNGDVSEFSNKLITKKIAHYLDEITTTS